MSDRAVENPKGFLQNIRRRFFAKKKAKTFIVREVGGKPVDLSQLEEYIGYQAVDQRYFVEALLHRSFLPYAGDDWQSNERLEFLGDAILSFLVAEHLHEVHPAMEEGELTKLRARLVNRRVLAQRAKSIHLLDFLFLSPSALQSIDSGAESILSDAFEAIIGAIYLDGGLHEARKFVHHTLLSRKAVVRNALMDDNYKSALLEFAQSKTLGIPRYSTVREEGPDHDRRFTVEVYVGEEHMGTGVGRNKKDAEQAAASEALTLIQNMNNNERPNAEPT